MQESQEERRIDRSVQEVVADAIATERLAEAVEEMYRTFLPPVPRQRLGGPWEAPAGWYCDPKRGRGQRYWDGIGWTNETRG